MSSTTPQFVTFFMKSSLSASKRGLEATTALIGYLLSTPRSRPQVDNNNILLMVGFNYNLPLDLRPSGKCVYSKVLVPVVL